MAGFCNKCGRPLPEDGICPCTMQQPQGNAAPEQPQEAPQFQAAPQPQGYVAPQ